MVGRPRGQFGARLQATSWTKCKPQKAPLLASKTSDFWAWRVGFARRGQSRGEKVAELPAGDRQRRARFARIPVIEQSRPATGCQWAGGEANRAIWPRK